MTKDIEIAKLGNIVFYSEFVECHRQIWRDGAVWSGYEQKPRFSDGLVFVVSNIKAKYRFSDGSLIECSQGDCLYIPKGSLYTVSFDNGSGIDLYTVNFLLKDSDSHELRLSRSPQILTHSTPSECITTASALADVYIDPEGSTIKKQYLLFSLLDLLSERTENNSDAYYPIRAGIALLKKEWNKNLPVSRYAEACGMKETGFYVDFKKWSGTSPIAYRNEIRMTAAKSMLKNSNLPIREIALKIGFDDQYYFSRIFKKAVGVSPREFRMK